MNCRALSTQPSLTAEDSPAPSVRTHVRSTRAVAHDFNNLLSVILGYADLLLEDLDAEGSPHGDDVRQIREAAQKARGLSDELLTSTTGPATQRPRGLSALGR